MRDWESQCHICQKCGDDHPPYDKCKEKDISVSVDSAADYEFSFHGLPPVTLTKFLAERAEQLDALFWQAIEPLVDEKIRILTEFGKPTVRVTCSGIVVETWLPVGASVADKKLTEAIDWLRVRFHAKGEDAK